MDNVNIKLLDNKSIVVFRGALNINHISAIMEEIEELVNFENDVDIQIDSPESIDITFMQMLLAMRNSCIKKGSRFEIKSQVSDDILALMKNAGLDEFLNN